MQSRPRSALARGAAWVRRVARPGVGSQQDGRDPVGRSRSLGVLVTVDDLETSGLLAVVDVLPTGPLDTVLVAPWGRGRAAAEVARGLGVDVLPQRASRTEAEWAALRSTTLSGCDAVLVLRASHRLRRPGVVALVDAVAEGGDPEDPADLVLGDADRWCADGRRGPTTVLQAPWLGAAPDLPYVVDTGLVASVLGSWGGGTAPDAGPLTALLAAARRVRVLGDRATLPRAATGAATSVARDPRAAVWRGWRARLEAERAALREAAPEAVRHWAVERLADDVGRDLDLVDGATVEEWTVFREVVTALVHDAGTLLPEVPLVPRLAAWLVERDDRDGVERLLTWTWASGHGPTASVVDGRVVLDLPDLGRPGRPPRSWAVPAPRERRPSAAVARLRPVDPEGGWELDVVLSVVAPRPGTVPDLPAPAVSGARVGPGEVATRPLGDPVLVSLQGDAAAARVSWAVTVTMTQAQLDAVLDSPPDVGLLLGVRDGTGGVVEVPASGLEAFPTWRTRVPAQRRGSADVAVTDVRLVAGPALEVDVTWLTGSPEPGACSATLTQPGQSGEVVRLRVVATGTDSGTVTLPLTGSRWGRPSRPLPVGPLELGVAVGDAMVRPDVASPRSSDLAGRLPLDLTDGVVRVRLAEGGRGRLLARLVPPLADEEVGPSGQQTLQRRYAEEAEQADIEPDTVLLQSYAAESATDSPLALHEEVRRTYPGLRTRWAVADHAVHLPEGAEPVVLGSAAWYAAMARSAYLVHNTPLPLWFRDRPGQRALQTFHGYPAKSMGIMHWEAAGDGPVRIAQRLQHATRGWTDILTPCPEMDVHYREQYAYQGRIISEGLPRDDDLAEPRRDELRRRARVVLGVAEHQRVLLYAPTWRDQLATRARVAHLDTHLDIHRLAEQLGDDWVVLLRGHRFHARGRRPAGSSRVLDVTTYPEINELVAASDAAVLDYSSLRFDVALAQVPTVFLVPDLDDYTGVGRGFLFDFVPTAPGPMVATTDEVAAELADLGSLRARTADDVAAFNARYQYRQDGHTAARVLAAFLGGPEEA